MDGAELFEMFAAHGVTTEEIAAQSVAVLEPQIKELRMSQPDRLRMSNRDIAGAILEYARDDCED